mgnify:CR=1 FL=1
MFLSMNFEEIPLQLSYRMYDYLQQKSRLMRWPNLLSRNFEEIPLQMEHRSPLTYTIGTRRSRVMCDFLQQKSRPWMAYFIKVSTINNSQK